MPQDDPKAPPPPKPVRKPYTKPKLTRYGNLHEVTAAIGNMSPEGDGGMPPVMKTS